MSEPALIARFTTPQALLAAAGAARRHQQIRLRAWTPWPVEGLADTLGLRRSRLPLAMLLGGLGGGAGTLALQAGASALDYPLDIGGRPLLSWPAFGPPALEMSLLAAGLVGILGCLLRSGLPRWHRREFDWPEIDQSAAERFVLLLACAREDFDFAALERQWRALGAEDVRRLEEPS